jgi:DNA-binding MurR/RpiR family transcriptional regulator
VGQWSDFKGGAIVRIHSAFGALLPAEQQVADYVLQNQETVANLSIQELAEQAGTSKSSVTRFSQRLEYNGFKEFRTALIRDMATGVTGVHEAITSEDDVETIIEKICQSNAQACLDTAKILNSSDLEKAAKTIIEAKRVLIIADGPVAAVAIDLYHKLLRAGIFSTFIQDRRLQNIQASLTRPGDVVIGLSYSGASQGAINTFKIAKENNAFTIAITNNMGSPITEISDLILYGTTQIRSIVTGTIEPRTAQLCVVDSLFMAIINLSGDKVKEDFQKVNKVIIDDWVK